MTTVKDALAQKSGALIHVRSGDMVVEALRQMRDNRVRSVLVIDDDVLVGIVTQGDCAIKVLLPGLDAKQTSVGQVMTGDPVTVKPDDQLEGCMAMMSARGFRHLPVLDAGKVVGVISMGDVVKDIIRNLEHNVGDLIGYIMTDGPGADRRTAVLSPASGRENGGAPLTGHPAAAEETASYRLKQMF